MKEFEAGNLISSLHFLTKIGINLLARFVFKSGQKVASGQIKSGQKAKK